MYVHECIQACRKEGNKKGNAILVRVLFFFVLLMPISIDNHSVYQNQLGASKNCR